MSAFDHYTLSPGALASMTEPTPDLQRNYRQRGMLEGYGERQENGRWMYSVSDLVGFWICDRISNRGDDMDRRDGFRIGKLIAGRVITSWMLNRHSWGEVTDLNPLKNRFFVHLFRGPDAEGVRTSEIVGINSLSDLNHLAFERVHILDIEALANALPESIKALLVVADENDADEATPDFDKALTEAPAVASDD